MKLLKTHQRERFARVASRLRRKRRSKLRGAKEIAAARIADADELIVRQSTLPAPDYSEGTIEIDGAHLKHIRLHAPSSLQLSNYLEAMSFIEELRRATFVQGRYRQFKSKARRSHFTADLSKVQNLTVDAALVVAAEFDRIRRARKFKPRMDDANWLPGVRGALDQLGFYELVETAVRTAPPLTNPPNFPWHFVRFACGRQVEPTRASQLLLRLEEAAGSQPDRRALYAGLIEAIGNVREHAYESRDRKRLIPSVGLWWAGGAFDPSGGRLHLSVYDQGHGIPHTIQSKAWYRALAEMVRTQHTHADRIAYALEYGRSSAGKTGRGNGLWSIVQHVDQRPGSAVHIWSGKGQVTYRGANQVIRRPLSARFCGTLIHWDMLV
jgi:hypothetical protein